MKREFKIRRVREEEIKSIIEINMRNLPEHYPEFFYRNIFENWPESFLVAEVNGKIVGYIMCRVEKHIHGLRIVKKGHVISIAVEKEYRRRGIGEALMRRAEEVLKNKVEYMFLEVRVSNMPAISLYKKLGYKIIRRIPFYYSDGEDAYLMEKEV